MLQRLLAQSVVEELSEHTQALRHCGVEVLFGEARFSIHEVKSFVSEGLNCSQTVIQATKLCDWHRSSVLGNNRSLGLVALTDLKRCSQDEHSQIAVRCWWRSSGSGSGWFISAVRSVFTSDCS